ncbi:hypothetical protein JG687_00001358 [Phytophthora cactorum]|uniref:PX domain-containing protein n=1 Tax=Phytophthora cactorum TaxID=29920 RepID=A0A8T1UXJ3_9STRA|nr:hypothetical protein PC120_g3932 [Phytophthora cactorum]KAG3081971.1 hypothetical protein PC121_g6276 [Phytophthora cactorum]KAG4061017.1 hypothetical protein PC123_g4106 [Phytophthora cactorum]KAG6972632.1 hypothetical protein JG687_00001358 [Phytophthora cactorum]
MASDKRPILSGKRLRNRRKRAALRAANRANASPTPECDSDEDAKRKQQQHLGLNQSRDDFTSSDKTASQSENEDEIDPSLVFVCRPTTPDFCSVFQPRGEDPTCNSSRKTQSHAADCKTFTVHISTFQETCEGYVTYTLELTTCDEPRHTFQVERRFSEFVACAVEVNKQLASGFAARCCGRLDDEESKAAASDDAGNFHWELPAKTWFRVTQTSALEERRAQLEQSLETLLLQQSRQMCNLPVIRDFLMLDIFGVQVAEQKNLEATAQFE